MKGTGDKFGWDESGRLEAPKKMVDAAGRTVATERRMSRWWVNANEQRAQV